MSSRRNDGFSRPAIQREFVDPWNRLVIDLEAIRSNYTYLKSIIPGDSQFYAVLKSDAYGHDLIETGKVLADAGCRHFAVDIPQEGIRLRNEGLTGEILLMNPIPLWMAELSVRHGLSISVIHESILEPLEEAARSMGKICRVHLNVNIGLNRLGIAPSKILRIAEKAASLPHITLIGLFGQPRDPASAERSYNLLNKIYLELSSHELAPRILHFANSSTLLSHPDISTDGVRLGILLYGVLPPEQHKEGVSRKQLTPAMRLKTKIVQIRQLPKGSKIGYRSDHVTVRDLTIATIPIGYGHGLDRRLSRGGNVLVRGCEAPFIGTVSMNSSTIDVTGIDQAGMLDEVMVVGRQGEREITMNDLAEKSHTIAAELMMRFGKSLPRDYRLNPPPGSSRLAIAQDPDEEIQFRYFQTENELPSWITVQHIVIFIQRNQMPLRDPPKTISEALDYALSTHPAGRGFVLLATSGRKVMGVVVNVQFDKIGPTPENLILYACVHRKHQGNGLDSRLIKETINCTEGNLRTLIHRENSAVDIFKKLGFTDGILELSYNKK